MLSKRERLERLCAGEKADRPGVALWRHWPGDDQHPEELARSTVMWQELFDWDFVKVSPDSNFCVEAWGAESRYVGGDEGNRQYTRYPVRSADDWARITPQDPRSGRLGGQLHCLELLGRQFGAETPFIQTIFSPSSQLKYLAGPERVISEIRTHPAAVAAALAAITETTLRFLDAMRASGAAGIYYAVQLATPGQLTSDEYARIIRPFDLQILTAAREMFWFNLLHLHGADAYFDLFDDAPVQAINWHDRDGGPSLPAARQRFPGALVGGLHQRETMLIGSPDDVRAQAADAIAATDGGRGFVLATGCVTLVTTPLGNIRAARQAVEPGEIEDKVEFEI